MSTLRLAGGVCSGLTLSGSSLPPSKAGLAFDPSSGRGCAAERVNMAVNRFSGRPGERDEIKLLHRISPTNRVNPVIHR